MNGAPLVGAVLGPVTQPGAQPPDAPVRTVIRQNREAGVGPYLRKELPLGLIGAILGLAVCMGFLAWWINRVSRRRAAAEDRAFAHLARRLRLGRAGRRVAQELAETAGLPPVALLASPGTLRAAVARVDAEAWSSRRGWKRVAALAGESTSGAVTSTPQETPS